MLNLITRLVQPIIKIRREEWGKTLLMFVYFFITITCLYILKPIRSAIFLEKSGFENLPYVWFITILVLMGVVSVYVRFTNKKRKNRLLIGTVLFFISNIFAFWWLLTYVNFWALPAIFYIWVSIFSIMSVTQFWTLSNDIFNTREAKRLFGFIGSGGILGGMTGGYVTGILVKSVGTINLLLVAACVLFFSVILIQWVWKRENSSPESKLHHDIEVEENEKKEQKGEKVLFKDLWKSKYLIMLLSVVFLAKLVSTLVEYQFNGIVQTSFIGLEGKTAFFGWFWGTLNMISFSIQFFLTSKVLRHLGVKVALLILPLGLLFGNIAILIHPLLWSAVFTMMYDGSLNYSLNQATKEVLYLPISREIRYKVKPFIDMVGYRSAKAFGSLLILLVTGFLITDLKNLSYLTVFLIGVWLFVAFVMKKEYLKELRKQLYREKTEISHIDVKSSESALLNSYMNTFLSSELSDRFLVLKLLNYVKSSKNSELFVSLDLERLDVAKKELKLIVKPNDLDPLDLQIEEELRILIKAINLIDIEVYMQFLEDCTKKSNEADMKEYLSSRYPLIQKVAFLFLVLNAESMSVEEFEGLRKNYKRIKSDFSSIDQVTNSKNANDVKRQAIEDKLRAYISVDASDGVMEVMEDLILDEELFVQEIEKLLKDNELTTSCRVKLFKIAGMIPKQKIVSILENLLTQVSGKLKNSTLETMNKVRVENLELVFNEKTIKKEILAQINEYENILKFLSGYQWKMEKTFSDTDAFQIAQEKRLDEIVHRIFLLLGLLCEPEDIRIVFQGFTDENDYIRANAIELLDNLLEPKLRKPVLSVLDGAESVSNIHKQGIKDYSWTDLKFEEMLKSIFISKNLWNGISSIVLMGRCGLKDLLTESSLQKEFSDKILGDLVHFAKKAYSEKTEKIEK